MKALQVLGLLQGATQASIKRAYRKLAQKHHPDKNKDPESEKKFILIKEAYDYLITGKSNSGIFDKIKSIPKPVNPKPKTSPTVWQTGYGAKDVEKVLLLVSFYDAFTGAWIRIQNTLFTIFVRPGIQDGQKERRLCRSQQGVEAYLDIEYKLYDPTGFYKLQELDGVKRFCCHLKMTTGQILCGFEHTLKNLDPSRGPVTITVSVNCGSYIVIPHEGLRLDESGRRSNLYVIPIVNFIPIEEEIEPVLIALNKKIQNTLKTYRFFK